MLLIGSLPTLAVDADELPPIGEWRVLSEMVPPPGMEAAPRAVRTALAEHRSAERALAEFRQQVQADWSQLRELELLTLSRWHRKASIGFQLPTSPGALNGSVVGSDRGQNVLYLRLIGPQLPVDFDIVERHLVFYASYDSSTHRLTNRNVSIFTEVFE